MVARLPPLGSLRAFEAAARRLSFKDAADELNVTPSALSYQVRQLEDHLQVELFRRLNRKVELTEAGHRLAPGLREAFGQMRAAVEQVTGADDDVLVVSTGPAFAAKWLAPRVWRFMEAHPELELRLSASLKLVDFAADEVDAAIRFGPGDYRDVVTEPLFEEALIPLCAPHLDVSSQGDLSRVALIHDDSSKPVMDAADWPEWLRKAGFRSLEGTRGPRFNHADHAIDAAVDGAGVVLGRVALVMRDIEAGRLVAPFPFYLPARIRFWFVTSEAKMLTPKVRTFRKWLAQETGEVSAAIAAFLADKRSL